MLKSWSHRLPWRKKKDKYIPDKREKRDDIDRSAIAVAIHEQTTDQQAARYGHEQHDNKEEEFWRQQLREARRLNHITLGGAVVAVFGLAVLFGTLILTRQSLIDANRAWIEPLDVTFDATNPPSVGKPISIILRYMNGGRDPALKVAYYSTSNAINFPVGGIRNLRVGVNLACNHATPTESGAAPTYAISNLGYYAYQSFISAQYSTPQVFRGDKLLFTVGCVGYETFGQPHLAGYCSYLLPAKGKPFQQWQWQRCADGHYAD